jgi:hypothetical protein
MMRNGRDVEMDPEKTWGCLLIHQLTNRQAILFGPNFKAILVQGAQKGYLSAFNLLVLGHQDNLFGWFFYLFHMLRW